MPLFKMSDGRTFTNWTGSCQIEEFIMNKNNITDSNDYRYFLQNNSEAIKKQLLEMDTNKCVLCPSCSQTLQKK